MIAYVERTSVNFYFFFNFRKNFKMPIVFNEPLSFLQRLVEYMEYVDLLEKASEETDPVARIQVSCHVG